MITSIFKKKPNFLIEKNYYSSST